MREGAQTFHFGDPAAALRAEARVCTPEVYWRLLTGGSLAAAEAWIDGDWESHQLTALLQILARNGEVLGRLERGFRLLGKPVARLRHWTRRNTRAQARENIAAHYDLGNEFYAHFLDDDLLYSSALFTDDEQDLTQAQRAKMARLCDQLALNPGDHLLEIGTGWGALAEYAARHYGCRVTTTTLSREQHLSLIHIYFSTVVPRHHTSALIIRICLDNQPTCLNRDNRRPANIAFSVPPSQ